MKNKNFQGSTANQVDINSLQSRVTSLEQTMAQKTAWPRWTRGMAMMALLVLVSLNLWLLDKNLQIQQQVSKEHLFWMLCHDGASSEERSRAFVRLLADGNTEWKSARLNRLNLNGANLSAADVQFAVLNDGIFTQADLTDARLFRSQLQLADLSQADLSGADLVETDFLKAQLHKTRFREANLKGVSFEQANLQEAEFVLADMTDAHLLMSDLTQADLTGANLSGANLEGAVLKRANLALTRLTDTHIVDTDFTDSNWWRSTGLSGEQLLELKQKFSPSQNADQGFRDDFAKWSQR